MNVEISNAISRMAALMRSVTNQGQFTVAGFEKQTLAKQSRAE